MLNTLAALPPPTTPCNSHHWGAVTDPYCAYSEGWAWFYPCGATNDFLFEDYVYNGALNDTLPETYDLEWGGNTPYPRGESAERAVATHLWDIYDLPNDHDAYNDDDNSTTFYTGITEIADVSVNYMIGGHFIYEFSEFCEGWDTFGYPFANEPGNIFLDIGVPKGTNCLGLVYAVRDHVPMAPPFALRGIAPNPSPGSARITYQLPTRGHVTLDVLTPSGRLIRRLVDRFEDPGEHAATWDGRTDGGQPVSSGVYFYRIHAAGRDLTHKAIVLR